MTPFNRDYFVAKELVYMADAIRNGHISDDGVFKKKCHAFFEEMLGVRLALLITACTHALAMAALLLLDIQLKDEVVVPSFTFVRVATAATQYSI